MFVLVHANRQEGCSSSSRHGCLYPLVQHRLVMHCNPFPAELFCLLAVCTLNVSLTCLGTPDVVCASCAAPDTGQRVIVGHVLEGRVFSEAREGMLSGPDNARHETMQSSSQDTCLAKVPA